MRMVMAIDEEDEASHINNMPACLKWALSRAEQTGNPVKLLIMRPGCNEARVFAEATPEGLRAVHAGRAWKCKSLERIYGQQTEETT